MKKLTILLAVVVLAAAVGIGVLVNQKNKVTADLNAANTRVADTQKLLDEANAKVTDTAAQLETAQVDLQAAVAAAETDSAELSGQLQAAKAEYDAARAELEQSIKDQGTALKDSGARVLGLQLMLENAGKDRDAAANKSTELMALLDTMTTEKGQMTVDLETAAADKAALNEKVAALEATKAELEGKVAALEAQVADLEPQVATLTEDIANAMRTGEETDAAMAALEAAKLAAEARVTELEAAVAEADTKLTAAAETETAKTDADARIVELEAAVKAAQDEAAKVETARAELETKAAELETKVAELESAAVDAQTALTAAKEVETAKAALEEKVQELEAAVKEADTKLAAAAELETAKTALEQNLSEQAQALKDARAQVLGLRVLLDNANKELETLKAVPEPEAEAVPEEAAPVKHGLGMVTSIGSVAEATAEKAGAAQVNTTVCSLVLSPEGLIQSVTWDVQQTKIQFSLEGKPVDLPEPEKILTKLEKGDAYGMRKASAIGKEWFEQIEAFGQFAIGKTVEEVLSIPVFEANPTHTQVPDVEELKASVTITVGDYLASLKKAADNAK